ncbi:hypothetical protein [Pelagibacterium halotolerans]|uniref:Uncharacterized protein n=1 Tax=Pelagibacterium halotolerans (strain DSM 22347 / JCM 15775 / CGMCC 1.7692 / B2) TaxID=1082931 RepID=G4RC84_PELHB|nr:hypothetical protein [Pelagibacterium halotolerans]AEQ52707.1 hypothetical protein KKY_2699 [Pelagibacterium halotolerans B2]QJR17590.1 hypothetical protein HKM20_03535 [Pelagibacterium halotolerans]SEA84799.1 hypothetical protein SAMN05428936_109102 [Pelagibacterium halotolerans]
MKTAIKHMNADQIRSEIDAIERKRQAINAEQDDLFDRSEALAIQRRELTGKLSEIGKRLFEIAKSTTTVRGEVDGLFVRNSNLAEKVEEIMLAERVVYREIEASFSRDAALDRRENLVMKRSRELQSEAA